MNVAVQSEIQANLAIAFLEESEESLDEYDGMCGELADNILQWLDLGDRVCILYIEPHYPLDDIDNGIDRWGWRFHMVVLVDGLVHDAWFPTLVLPPDEYIEAAFPDQELRWEVTK